MENVDYKESLDSRSFSRQYQKPGKPVIIQGAIESWYESDLWRFESFADLYRNTEVPLRFPAEPKAGQALGFEHKSDTVESYMEKIIQGQPAEECGYLASLPLMPALKKLAVFPDYLWVRRLSGIQAWLGPGGTESAVHCDLLDNLFAQVKGRKQFQLYYPASIKQHGPREFNSLLASPQDQLSPPDPDYEFILEEGEMLYIPPYVWHRVISLEASISVTQIWYSPSSLIRDMPSILRPMVSKATNKLRVKLRALCA